MGSETVGTLVVVGVIVAVLALYVLAIGLGLRKLSFTLGTIIVGLRSIREQTRPVAPVLGSVVTDVSAIEDALDGLIEAVGEALGEPDEPVAPAPVRARTTSVRAKPAMPELAELEELDELDVPDDGEAPMSAAGAFEDDDEDDDYELEPEPAIRVRVRQGIGVRDVDGMKEAVARAKERMAAGVG